MAIDFRNPLTLARFDFSSLSSFYQAGGSLSLAARRAKLEAEGLGSLKSYDPSVIPPWDLRQPQPSDDAERLGLLFRAKSAIDLGDPLVNRTGNNDAFRNLFGLYRGLARLRELATYAETGRNASLYARMLDGRFQQMMSEVRGFADGIKLPGLSIISGIKQSSVLSSVITPKPVASTLPEHRGAVVTDAADAAIAGIGAGDSFTLTVTTSSQTRDIAIDLSQIDGPLTIGSIAGHINDRLEAEGFLSRFALHQYSETSYGFRIAIANGETLRLAATPGTERPALYVAGASGSGDGAAGFLRKLEDLDGAAPAEAFRSEIATARADDARGVAVDSLGNVYVVGTTAGDLEGQANQGTPDAYIRKYDAAGQLIWSRLLGAASEAGGFAVAVDADDNVVIAGQTRDRLGAAGYGGNLDTFVTKYDADGRELWTRQAAPYADDAGLALAVGADGGIFVAGYANAALSDGLTHAGGADATLVKLGADGGMLWTRQFGGTGNDVARAVTVDDAGHVYVAAEVDGRAVVRKYVDDTAAEVPLWEADLGPLAEDGSLSAIALGSDGAIYVAGTSAAGFAGIVVQPHGGGRDGFVARIAADGTADWISYVGTGGNDGAAGLAVRSGSGEDEIYLTGSTGGALNGGGGPTSASDAFVARLDAAGATQWVEQFGGAFSHRGTALALDPTGSDVVARLGLPSSPVPATDISEVVNLTTARAGMSFAIQVNGGAARQITIESGDSYGFLAFKINRILGSSGYASIKSTAEGLQLQIEARNGGRIDLRAGPDGFDALAPLGLKPVTLFGKRPEEPATADGADARAQKHDGVYALGFFDALNLLDRRRAAEAGIIIDNAMRTLREAYALLNPSPKLTDPLAGVNISDADRQKLAALTLGLQNITAINRSLQGSTLSVKA